jgi:hypothetical protein
MSDSDRARTAYTARSSETAAVNGFWILAQYLDAEATWLALPKLLHPLRGNRLFERLVGVLCVNQNVRVNENGASRVMVMFFIPGPSKHRPK